MSRVVFEYLAAGAPADRVAGGRGARGARPTASTRPWCRPATPAALAAGADGLARRRASPRPAGRGRASARARALFGGAPGRRARGPLRAPDRGVKISILAFDLSDNATGRADLLARLLAPRWDVEVVGPRFGARVWRPGRRRADRAIARCRGPAALSALRLGVVARCSRRPTAIVLYASKPRPDQLRRRAAGPPPARAGRCCSTSTTGRSASSAARMPGARSGGRSTSAIPNGLPWTWLMERLVPAAPTRSPWPRDSWSAASAARSSPTCATPRPGIRPATTARPRARALGV